VFSQITISENIPRHWAQRGQASLKSQPYKLADQDALCRAPHRTFLGHLVLSRALLGGLSRHYLLIHDDSPRRDLGRGPGRRWFNQDVRRGAERGILTQSEAVRLRVLELALITDPVMRWIRILLKRSEGNGPIRWGVKSWALAPPKIALWNSLPRSFSLITGDAVVSMSRRRRTNAEWGGAGWRVHGTWRDASRLGYSVQKLPQTRHHSGRAAAGQQLLF
jgi:hypothetical protein